MAMKDIEGYEGLYDVTDDGKVWSYRTNKYLKSDLNNTGYSLIGLYKDGKRKRCLLHRLVAQAYCDNTDSKLEVNHVDGDKTNNCASNLQWTTAAENSQHAWDNGLRTATKAHREAVGKTGLSTRKFNDAEVKYIRRMFTDFGFSQTNIAHHFQTVSSTIYNIVSRKTYSEVY
jgi:hypothetical protein